MSYSNVEFLDFKDATTTIADYVYSCYEGKPNIQYYNNNINITPYAILSSSSNNKVFYK
jgi:hypothetical protein